MPRRRRLLPLLSILVLALPAGAAVARDHAWSIAWSHPPDDERFDVEMHAVQACTLTVTNLADGHYRFTYGLDWDATPLDVLGDETDAGFFADHTRLEIDGEAYPRGAILTDWFAPRQTKRYVFEITYDWIWLRPWSAWRILEAAASFLPGSSEYRLVKAAAALGDAWTVLSLLHTQFTMIPECRYAFEALGSAAEDGEAPVVSAWVKEEKALYLASSLINTVAGSVATKIGYACLAGGPWGAIAATAFFVVEACNLAAAEYYYVCAYDPVEDYDAVVQPAEWDRPDLSGLGTGPARDMAELALDLPALAGAELDAFARAEGAACAGDPDWERRQRAAAAAAADRSAGLLAGMAHHAAILLPDIPDHDEESYKEARASLGADGLPGIEDEILLALGWRGEERDAVTSSLLAADGAAFANCRTIAEELADAASVVGRVLEDPDGPLRASVTLLPTQLHVEDGPTWILARLAPDATPWTPELRLRELDLNGTDAVVWWVWDTDIPGEPAVATVFLDLGATDMAWTPGQKLLALNGRLFDGITHRPVFGGAVLEILPAGAVSNEDPPPPPDAPPIPARTRLAGAHPNPFNPAVTVSYELSRPGRVRIDVVALDGARVRTLLDDRRPAGAGRVVWDGRDEAGRAAPAGTYLVVLEGEAATDARKIVLAK